MEKKKKWKKKRQRCKAFQADKEEYWNTIKDCIIFVPACLSFPKRILKRKRKKNEIYLCTGEKKKRGLDFALSDQKVCLKLPFFPERQREREGEKYVFKTQGQARSPYVSATVRKQTLYWRCLYGVRIEHWTTTQPIQIPRTEAPLAVAGGVGGLTCQAHEQGRSNNLSQLFSSF